MRKLGSKGMTIVEILVCFVLVGLITVSIYSSISTFNNKKNVESYKEKIYTYKNTLTKIIQDDLIKNGLIKASYSITTDSSNIDIYTINLSFRDGTSKSLIIKRRLAMDYNEAQVNKYGPKKNDYFMIEYDQIEYPIPDFGEYENDRGETIKDLRINNMIVSTNSNVLTVYIGLYHPDLSTRYGISLVCPINSF